MNFKSVSSTIDICWEGLLNSYSKIFFSNNKVFAFLLLAVSFFDIGAGLSGVIAIITSQVTGRLFNFKRELIRDGSYTYNSLMVGMALGVFYNFTGSYFVILVITSILTLFLTIWFETMLGKHVLPFLSIPFLFGVWIIILGAPNFSALELTQKEVLSLAKWYPELFEGLTHFISQIPGSNIIHLYLRSLGAIFFQYNDLVGLFIAVGILFYSRIAFGLSIFGFFIGFAFYSIFGGDFSQLIYSYIGFNFILTSIAIGGYFVIPSRKSYLMLLFIIPVIALSISSLHTLFNIINLPLYSLPFNIVTLLYLASMATRHKASGITLVTLQRYSPEKNLYNYKRALSRFKNDTYYHICLPINRDWNIPQGHTGDITHKGNWRHAWDFDVLGKDNKTYKNSGIKLSDYHCYELPVFAPADGYVADILDGIEDNNIGEVNLKDNWGNTIVIKHGEHFYSKLCHLKKNSFKVAIGDFVKRGQKIGLCGSSGRSPEPHLHFQLQSTPYIGSTTIPFPIAYYLTKKDHKYTFHSFEIPKEKEKVSNVRKTKLLTDAFAFTPGKILKFIVDNEVVKWEVFLDAYGKTYIYCYNTKSTAYFVNNGTLFYFTDFYGKEGSLLQHFYFGAQKVLLGYYKDVQLEDELLIDGFFNPFITGLHDLTAPFFNYCKVQYRFGFTRCNDLKNPTEIEMKSTCTSLIGTKKFKERDYFITVKNGEIYQININNTKYATCEV